MRILLPLGILSVLAAPAAAVETIPSPNDAVSVVIDHAKVLRLPDGAQTVIVGNPMIADVSVQKTGILVLTGKSYGQTNLIALDGGGTLIAESLISVQAPEDAVVTVQRGLDRESYSCTPNSATKRPCGAVLAAMTHLPA